MARFTEKELDKKSWKKLAVTYSIIIDSYFSDDFENWDDDVMPIFLGLIMYYSDILEHKINLNIKRNFEREKPI